MLMKVISIDGAQLGDTSTSPPAPYQTHLWNTSKTRYPKREVKKMTWGINSQYMLDCRLKNLKRKKIHMNKTSMYFENLLKTTWRSMEKKKKKKKKSSIIILFSMDKPASYSHVKKMLITLSNCSILKKV